MLFVGLRKIVYELAESVMKVSVKMTESVMSFMMRHIRIAKTALIMTGMLLTVYIVITAMHQYCAGIGNSMVN